MIPELPLHIYVDTPAAMQACLAVLQQVDRFAIDLESNGLFAYREQICLIQISTEDQDFIIDPLADLDWQAFGALIESPHVEKVLHASEYDLILMKRQHGWDLQNLFDTMWAARILGYEKIGLANMLEALYGYQISKKYQRANWCARPLKPEQLDYAQTDTYFLLQMRDDLWGRLVEQGSGEEALEIFAEQAKVKVPDVSFSADGFWSINGVLDLPPQRRAILRELNIFRDQESERRDRPPFKVFSNTTLLEIASRAPKTLDQLQPIKGMTRLQIRRYGKRLLECVMRGMKMPIPKQKRRKRTPEPIMQRYDKLHLWRKERARGRGVASDVVMNRDTLWDIAHAAPQTLDELGAIQSLGPWRFNAYGAEMMDVLQS